MLTRMKERRSEARPEAGGKRYSRFLYITPEMARRWLELNSRNRNLSGAKASLIIRDWERHRPQEENASHQGIAFYASDGSLADGQHRLYACAKSGIPFWSEVTWNLPEEAAPTIDRHRPRSESDVISIAGLSDWIHRPELSLIKMIAAAHRKGTTGYSVEGLVEMGEAVKRPVVFALEAFKGKRRRHVVVSSVMAAVAIASEHVDKVRLLHFCEVLVSGVSESQDDAAAVRLRDQLITEQSRGGQTGRREVLLKTMRAIKAFDERDPLGRLVTPKEPIYRLPEIEKYL